MLVAALGIAWVRTKRRDTRSPRPTWTIEFASWSGTQREPSFHRALLGTGTRTALGLKKEFTGSNAAALFTMKLAIMLVNGVGGVPVSRPSFRARMRSRDCWPMAPPSRGVYERRAAYSSRVKRSDGKVEPRAGQEVEDVAGLLELDGAILGHLPRPFKPPLGKLAGVDEQRSP